MFFPLKDENPTQRKPFITIALIAVNALIYFFSATKGTQGFQAFVIQYGLIPYEITHTSELTPQLGAPVYLTFLTSMFMHGGIMHLAGNMLFLWVFGNNIEDYLGHIKFLLFYLTAGFAADGLFILFSPNSQIPLVGASGAIAGVLGAYLVLYPKARIHTLIFLLYFIRVVKIPAAIVLGFWFFYQILMSAMASGSGGGVAWLAHVGGFAFGWVLFRIFASKPRGDQRIYRVQW